MRIIIKRGNKPRRRTGADRLNCTIQVRVTAAEKALIHRYADRVGGSESDAVRDALSEYVYGEDARFSGETPGMFEATRFGQRKAT